MVVSRKITYYHDKITGAYMTSRRGRVLKDTAHGDGIISIDGQQHHFTLEQHWRSDVAPLANTVVDCEFDDQNVLQSVKRVSDEQIAKEKAAQLSNDAMAVGKAIGGRILSEAGTPAVVAFLAFLIGGLAISSLTIKIDMGAPNIAIHFSFYKLLCLANIVSDSIGSHGISVNLFAGDKSTFQCSATEGYSLLFFIAALLPLLPHFYKAKKEAWLAYAAPAAFLVYVCGNVYYHVQGYISTAIEEQDKMRARMGAYGMMPEANKEIDTIREALAKMYSIDFGLYIVIAAALVLALIGIKKYLIESGKSAI